MAFQPWFIEFTEPGPGTLSGTLTGTATSVLPSAASAQNGNSASAVTPGVTPADLAALQTLLFGAVAAEASARAGADTVETQARIAADNALHAADAQIYEILINGTGGGGGGGDDDILALQAWTLAQIGTNTGTYAINLTNTESTARAAADASEAATRAAADAALHSADAQIYSILINGTGGGNPGDNGAFALAVRGTNIANEALGIACIGTNTGTFAINLANTGSALAWEAFVMAGTSTGGSPGDNGAFALAVRGTNIANEALGIAIIGTTMTALDTFWIGTLNTEVNLHTIWIGTLNSSGSGGGSGTFSGTGAVPVGGFTGQYLVKSSGSNYDMSWIDPGTGVDNAGLVLLTQIFS